MGEANWQQLLTLLATTVGITWGQMDLEPIGHVRAVGVSRPVTSRRRQIAADAHHRLPDAPLPYPAM
jgi:hypothetical protein